MSVTRCGCTWLGRIMLCLGVVTLAMPAGAVPPPLGHYRCVTPGRDACLPIFSPDGQRLAMSRSAFRGLSVVELTTGARRDLADEGGVAFHARWNATGDALWVRTRSETSELLRLEELRLTGVRRTFAGPAPEVSYAAPRGTAWQVLAGRSLLNAQGAHAAMDLPEDCGATWALTADGALAAVVTRHGRLVVADLASGRTHDVPAPRAGAGTLYGPLAAPSGHVIVANRLGEGLVFIDLDRGSEIVAGEGTSPCWLPDGSGVICEVTRDDGHGLTASALVWVPASPAVARVTVLAVPGFLPRHPAVSPDGAWLAFDTPRDGVFVAPWSVTGGER